MEESEWRNIHGVGVVKWDNTCKFTTSAGKVTVHIESGVDIQTIRNAFDSIPTLIFDAIVKTRIFVVRSIVNSGKYIWGESDNSFIIIYSTMIHLNEM